MTETVNDRYYLGVAAAYVRGRLEPDVAEDELEPGLVSLGLSRGWPMYHFKRSSLPRVARVLGTLRGLAPTSVLDVGCGRGAFLWPLIDEMPQLEVLAIDLALHRLHEVGRVHRGGFELLRGMVADVGRLGLGDDSYEVVTALEVLEHLEHPEPAARELVRVARRFVIVSVPAKADSNPQHRQLFSRRSMSRLLLDAGAAKVDISYVLNHMIAVAGV